MKLEIGPAYNPHQLEDEWEHLDIMKRPHVELISPMHIIDRPDDYYEEIYASNVIEHATKEEFTKALDEWTRVLKKDGLLTIITPDLYQTAKDIIRHYDHDQIIELNNDLIGLFAQQINEHDFHTCGFTSKSLSFYLKELGFTDLQLFQPEGQNGTFGLRARKGNIQRSNEKMKIAIVCPTSHVKPYNGNSIKEFGLGASWTAVIYLSRELRKLGHEVVVLNHTTMRGIYDGVNYPCKIIPQDLEKFDVKQALKDTDVLIVNRAGCIDWFDCLTKFADIMPKKRILWCHDSGGAEKGQPDKFAQYDKVVSVSEWLNEINRTANLNMNDYFIDIPIGVDTELFKPSDTADRFSICFCGAVNIVRRPHYALYAFAELIKMYPNFPWKFHILGTASIWGGPPEGTDANFKKIWQDAKNLIPADKLIDHGDLSNYKVAELLPKMGMLVFPTITETCGVTILEAQASGVPVIVPDDSMHTAVKERIYHTETGVVRNFGNIQEVVLAMYDMATNDHIYNKVRNQAREKVVKDNDWSYIAKRWVKEAIEAPSAYEIRQISDMIKKQEIGVGVLSFQDRPLLEKCINSLKVNADMPIRIIVWDNASASFGSDNVAWLKANHPDIDVYESPENIGCTKSRNYMVQYIHEKYPHIKYILLSDMDVLYMPQFLYPMVNLMENHDDAFIVGYSQAICGFRPDENGRVPEIMSISSLYRIECFDDDKIGKFDERFVYYAFDSEVAQRANIKGWHTYVVMGRKGYSHVGGHANKLISKVEEIKRKDVELWQSIADQYSLSKRWEDMQASDYIVMGNKLKDNKDYDKSNLMYMTGISRFPDNDTLYYCLGNLYKDQKQWDKALEMYKQAKRLNPRNLEIAYVIDEVRSAMTSGG